MEIKIKKKTLQILKCIPKLGGTATANKIKKKSGISYVTVQKYLRELERDKIIKYYKNKGRKYYSIDYEYLHSDKL